jgi:glycine/D-amino acid oxidase-like deaminating enzyme
MHVVIVGAGTFGASLAWRLAGSGQEVTLIDQFGAGDCRASSGGETRLFRHSHGTDERYTAMARRSGELWGELEEESGQELLVRSGVAWFAHGEHGWEADSERALAAQGIPAERLDPGEAARLFPSLGCDDLSHVLFEPSAGVLRAQRAVRALAAQAEVHGARVVRERAEPGRVEGDAVVWACGAWLPRLFPGLVELTVTCQEVLLLEGGPEWAAPGVPGWVDYDRAMYGTGDVDGLGFKASLDVEGPPLDADAPLPAGGHTEAGVRAYLADRFPALERAPLAAARTCRYELSPDSHFIAAPHPSEPATWIVGGGSGHGFKHGPAMAELLAGAIAGGAPLPAHFGLHDRLPARSLRTAGSGA